jgi:hypothetical protein
LPLEFFPRELAERVRDLPLPLIAGVLIDQRGPVPAAKARIWPGENDVIVTFLERLLLRVRSSVRLTRGVAR